VLLILIGVVVAMLVGIQFIPVSRTNPPVTTTMNWDSPQTEALFKRACADCHSNATVWPVYAYVAPVSWLISFDVTRGRSQLNFSTLGAAPTPRQNTFEAPPFPLALIQQLLGSGERRPGGDRPGGGGQGFQGGGDSGNRNALTTQNIARMLGELSRQVSSGAMPPANYIALHPEANLSAAERDALISGLTATLKLMAQPTPGATAPAQPTP